MSNKYLPKSIAFLTKKFCFNFKKGSDNWSILIVDITITFHVVFELSEKLFISEEYAV